MDYKEKVIVLLNSQELSKEQKEKLESIFPELKESEDEKIRKAIIGYINHGQHYGVSNKDMISWLEKQGEQKPDDVRTIGYGHVEDVEQKPTESNNIKGILLVHDKTLNNLLERYKTSATFKTLIVNLQNWWNNTRRHLLSFNIEQKPAWRDEDERLRTSCIKHIEEELERIRNDKYGHSEIISDLKESCRERINWLKSLKERVQPQPKQWSEEDDQYLLVCKNALAKYQVSDKWDAIIISRWLEDKLKSLRPQNTWKPSERQKEALLWCVVHLGGADKQTLGELLEELNKL